MSDWYRLNDDYSVTKLASGEYPNKSDEDRRRGSQLTSEKIDGFYVSTVFLGLDHGWGGDVPVLWESMVFNNSDEGMSEYDCERYTSYKEATIGHQRLIERIKASTYKRSSENAEGTDK